MKRRIATITVLAAIVIGLLGSTMSTSAGRNDGRCRWGEPCPTATVEPPPPTATSERPRW